jgi:hypothetical protein
MSADRPKIRVVFDCMLFLQAPLDAATIAGYRLSRHANQVSLVVCVRNIDAYIERQWGSQS